MIPKRKIFPKKDFNDLFEFIENLRSADKNGNILIVKNVRKLSMLLSRAYLQLKNWE